MLSGDEETNKKMYQGVMDKRSNQVNVLRLSRTRGRRRDIQRTLNAGQGSLYGMWTV